MQFTLNVLESSSSFRQKVVQAICDEMNRKLGLIKYDIRNSVANNLKPIFINTEDYSLMMNDPKILGDMGLPHNRKHDIMDKILQRICDSVEVDFHKFIPVGSSIYGGFDIGILISDYSDILELNEAYIKSKNGFNEWLDWLLYRGADFVVAGYHVTYKTGSGRSTLAIMTEGGRYMVDDRIQGTKNDNWLTRALKTNEEQLKQVIFETAEEIERAL